MSATVAGSIRTIASATAVRSVSGLAETSTIRARPCSSTWERLMSGEFNLSPPVHDALRQLVESVDCGRGRQSAECLLRLPDVVHRMLTRACEPSGTADDLARLLDFCGAQRTGLLVDPDQFGAIPGRRVLQSPNDRKRYLAFAKVPADGLPERLFVADEVEDVVGDLEGHADVVAVI